MTKHKSSPAYSKGSEALVVNIIKNEQGLGSQIMVIISVALILGFLSKNIIEITDMSFLVFVSARETTQRCLSWPASSMHTIGNWLLMISSSPNEKDLYQYILCFLRKRLMVNTRGFFWVSYRKQFYMTKRIAWLETAWVEAKALPLTSCVALGKLLNLSEPSFLIHQTGGYYTYVSGKLRWIFEILGQAQSTSVFTDLHLTPV